MSELRYVGMPPLTVIVSGLVLDQHDDGAIPLPGELPFRLSAEVSQWCEETLSNACRLFALRLHFKIDEPYFSGDPIEGDTEFPLLEFGSVTDEIAFRLRWMGA